MAVGSCCTWRVGGKLPWSLKEVIYDQDAPLYKSSDKTALQYHSSEDSDEDLESMSYYSLGDEMDSDGEN